MPSLVWDHFDRSEEGDNAKCNKCGIWMSCKGTTTSLKYHLQQKHRVDFSDSSSTSSRSTRSTPVPRFTDESTMDSESTEVDLAESIATDDEAEGNMRPGSSSGVEKVGLTPRPFVRKKQCRAQKASHCNSAENPLTRDRLEAINAEIARMIAVDMLPLSFSENRGFVDLMNTVIPGYNIPGRKSIQNRIESLYVKTKDTVTTMLKAASSVALTTDAWSSRSTKSYVTVTAHFLNADWKLSSLTLETTEFEERHTAINLRAHLDETTKRWHLTNKVTGITHDNASNITAAVRDSDCVGMSVPCFAHTLQYYE